MQANVNTAQDYAVHAVLPNVNSKQIVKEKCFNFTFWHWQNAQYIARARFSPF